jgi:DNA modification methylase
MPKQETIQHDKCGKCGAIRTDKQLGLEKTPEEYVERMTAIFREVRRVLRGDGTAWVNMGDSYAGGGGFSPGAPSNKKSLSGFRGTKSYGVNLGIRQGGHLKKKDLCGIPWRLAFALQADGWYLRQDIIWSKPNPMPESVTDRCTKAHEYIFLLSKSPKYYYDADAIKEPASESTHARVSQDVAEQIRSERANGGSRADRPMKAVICTPKQADPGNGNKIKNNSDWQNVHVLQVERRNKRSVWTVTTGGFSEAHFATFPEKLIEPCILAGCPVDGIVLDPFAGAGTTPLCARKLSRHFIGIELKPEYVEIADRRLNAEIPLLL